MLIIRRGKGTYIAHHPGEISDPLGFAYFPDQLQLGFDLLEVRLNLEPWIARVAAERATDEEIAVMNQNCRTVEQDILSGKNHLPNGNILLSQTIVGHRAIADAISAHDPDQAEKSMRTHIEQNLAELNAIRQELLENA